LGEIKRTEDKVRAVFFLAVAFREADVAVFVIELEALLFPRNGGAWVFFGAVGVSAFAVAGRIRCLVPVFSVAIPGRERLSEFFEDSLAGLTV
jgi:hypothetical protein